ARRPRRLEAAFLFPRAVPALFEVDGIERLFEPLRGLFAAGPDRSDGSRPGWRACVQSVSVHQKAQKAPCLSESRRNRHAERVGLAGPAPAGSALLDAAFELADSLADRELRSFRHDFPGDLAHDAVGKLLDELSRDLLRDLLDLRVGKLPRSRPHG